MVIESERLERGRALHRQGDVPGAAAVYQAILESNPDSAAALHYLGLTRLQIGDLGAAEQLMTHSLSIDPACANTLSDLGIVKVRQDKPRESLQYFARALQIDANHLDALNNLAATLKQIGLFDRALPLYERLSVLAPQSANIICSLADAQFQTNRIEEAVASYHRSVKLDPAHKQARLGLGEAYESVGKFKQARVQYLSVLRRDADSPLALSRLLQLREGEIEEKWIEKAHALCGGDQIEPEARIRLNVALGHYHDRRKSYATAFHHFKAGCDEQSSRDPYDSRSYTRAIDSLIEVLTEEFFSNAKSSMNLSEKPVFIVGMPRSGTTLTEQILASHSQIAAGGELSAMLHVSHSIRDRSRERQPYPWGLRSVSEAGLSRMADEYLQRLEKVSASARRVTDKLPFNFMHLGVVALLFPKARVIHCVRSPMDNCLSCYFTSFADQIRFANTLESLGRYYLDYHRLMEHWRRVLPIEIYDLRYEDLVNDTERSIAGLLKYCGVDWEDACVNYHATERGIRTPSRWQVRQPIYASSLERWRNYEQQILPLKEILSPLLERRTESPTARGADDDGVTGFQ